MHVSHQPLSLSPAVVSSCRGDIVFILDSSASLDKLKWYVIKQFAIDVIRGLKIGADQTRVGIVSFSTTAVTNFHLQQYYDVDEMANKIYDMTYAAGATNIADGIMVCVICCSASRYTDMVCHLLHPTYVNSKVNIKVSTYSRVNIYTHKVVDIGGAEPEIQYRYGVELLRL